MRNGAPGVRIEPLKPLPLMPDVPHARLHLESAHCERLAGDGWDAYVKPFRSIEDLANRRPGLVKPALTSRDIAGLEAIPAAPRRAFGRLAAAVERSFFGGRAADAAAFAATRADYEAFAFAESWR